MAEDLEREMIRATIASYHTTRLGDVSAEAHIQGKPSFRKAMDTLLAARAEGLRPSVLGERVSRDGAQFPDSGLVARSDVLSALSRLADEHADLALEGGENARNREAMEAAFSRAKHAVAFLPEPAGKPVALVEEARAWMRTANIGENGERYIRRLSHALLEALSVKADTAAEEICPLCARPILAGEERGTGYFDGEGPVDMHEACCNPNVDHALQEAWDWLGEVDDRTSEHPDMMLVTWDELKRAMQEAVQSTLAAPPPTEGAEQNSSSRSQPVLSPKSDNADGWLNWIGGPCPVEPGTLVDVQYRDGRAVYGVPAGHQLYGKDRCAVRWNYYDVEVGTDIIGYRTSVGGEAVHSPADGESSREEPKDPLQAIAASGEEKTDA